jgi:signal transduction histidine kinase
LLAMMLLVVAVGAATFVGTALLIAPRLFADHLAQAGDDSPALRTHASEAFETAFSLSVGVAVVLAAVAAVGVAWMFSRRVGRTISGLATAARHVADGDYGAPIPPSSFGRELEDLSQSFAQLARTLADTDVSRAHLLADLAHELRTPLATLQAYIDGLEDGVVEPTGQAFETMRGQTERIERLGADLRDAAAAQEDALAMAPEPCDLADVVTKAVAAAHPSYESAGIDLTIARSEPAPVRGDSGRLSQVIANLLANAARHTPSGGSVAVSTIVINGCAVVEVNDTGEGIPVDELEAVFERFHRVDTARSHTGGGSGLGLTISRAIASAHGGTLVAASEGVGLGSRFRLTVPLARVR